MSHCTTSLHLLRNKESRTSGQEQKVVLLIVLINNSGKLNSLGLVIIILNDYTAVSQKLFLRPIYWIRLLLSFQLSNISFLYKKKIQRERKNVRLHEREREI